MVQGLPYIYGPNWIHLIDTLSRHLSENSAGTNSFPRSQLCKHASRQAALAHDLSSNGGRCDVPSWNPGAAMVMSP